MAVSYTHLDVYKRQHLDGEYAAFGKVIDGRDVVNKIAEVRTDYMDNPLEAQVKMCIRDRVKTELIDFIREHPEDGEQAEDLLMVCLLYTSRCV